MQADFHYYATYCAAYLAGYDHRECLEICYSANFVDWCSDSLLSGLGAPKAAATTQLQPELVNAGTDILGLQNMTRIWSSFHFLPYDLRVNLRFRCSVFYRNKYRLICRPNGRLLTYTVNLAKGMPLQAVGLAMHVLADTWAHMNFAGTPSLVINNTGNDFTELLPDGSERKITFIHNPVAPDNLEKSIYVNSLYQTGENSIMNLGHGRAGHLPDYSFARYTYMPAWNNYETITKDNPSDYYHAFCQMIYAMKYLRGEIDSFETNRYYTDLGDRLTEEVNRIINIRRTDASEDWKALGESLSGESIDPFELTRYNEEYKNAPAGGRDETFLGRFIAAAIKQKNMVSAEILNSGSMLAGFPTSVFRIGGGKIL